MAGTIKKTDYYTLGYVEIAFPQDKVCCMNCELLTSDNLNRPKCRKTNSLIYEPRLLPDNCPINFTGEIRGTKPREE